MAKLGSIIHQAKPPKRPEGMRKDRTALERLGQMVWPNNICLDDLT